MRPAQDTLIVTAPPRRRARSLSRLASPPPRRSKSREVKRSSREVRRSRETRVLKERPRRLVPLRKLFLVGLFFLGQGLFFFSELFHLSRIEVNGLSHLTREQVVSHARLTRGSPVWLLPPATVAERVAGIHAVKSVQVEVRLPGTVEIAVQEREPRFLVGSPASPELYLADAHGVLLRKAQLPSSLPRVMVTEPLAEGGRLSQGIVPIASETLALLHGIVPGKPSSISIDSLEAVTVETSWQGWPLTLRLGSLEHRDYKRQLLQALWARLPASKGRPVLLDLRYSSPVVKVVKPSSPEPANY
ncbi:hypothetical protein DYH09_12155 [bacterium CPR1]|nr:hypothetical protein [bacterium CPR1]